MEDQPPQPLQIRFTKEELADAAKAFLLKHQPKEQTLEQRNKYLMDLGLLTEFVYSQFE